MTDAGFVGEQLRRITCSLPAWLPRGGLLPSEDWNSRHRALVASLGLSAIGLSLYGALAGYDPVHNLVHSLVLFPLALLAASERLGSTVRVACASLGLLTAAALLVHVTGGLIEAHFLFFVVIVALTLYEAWLPFLLAAAYVLIHHGVLGMTIPEEVYSHSDAWSNPWLWAVIHAFFVSLAGAVGIIAWRLNENVRERMYAAQRELEALARTDDLTKLPNRRWLYDELHRESVRARRQGLDIRVAVIDVDNFKAFNDRLGHAAGDALLRQAAEEWRSILRASDFLGRVGGDEFVLLLPDCSAIEAEAVVDRLRSAMPGGRTCSVGIACWDGLEAPEELLRRADEVLYRAKADGRDRVVSADLQLGLAA